MTFRESFHAIAAIKTRLLQNYLTGDIQRAAVELSDHAFCGFQTLPLDENVVYFQQQFQ